MGQEFVLSGVFVTISIYVGFILSSQTVLPAAMTSPCISTKSSNVSTSLDCKSCESASAGAALLPSWDASAETRFRVSVLHRQWWRARHFLIVVVLPIDVLINIRILLFERAVGYELEALWLSLLGSPGDVKTRPRRDKT